MGGPFLSACGFSLPACHDVSALPVIRFPEPLFALLHMHCIAQHSTRGLLATLCSLSGLQVRI
jgi:hypothetical protein